MSVTWKQEIIVPEETRRMIVACGDKRGLGMAVANALNRQNDKTVNAIRGKLRGTLLHVRSTNLIQSLGMTQALLVSGAGGGGEVRSSVGSGVATAAKSVSYAAPLEFGSKPHVIRPLPGRGPRASLRFIGRNGQVVFAKAVNHPGNKAYSFVRGTVEERLPAYAKDVGETAFGFLTRADGATTTN